VTRATAYSQVVVKAGAERSYLIAPEKLGNLAECKNLEELKGLLNKTPYEDALKNVERPSAKKMQHAFKEELIRVCSKIVHFSPKEIQDFLRIYLSRLEIENLKSILKAKSAKIPYETLIGRLHLSIEEVFGRKDLFIQAAKADDIKGVMEAFKETIYSPILLEGASKYEEAGSTRFFDFALDRAYFDNLLDSFERLPSKDSEIVFSCLGPRIDGYNMLTIIRSKLQNYPSHLTFRAVTHRFYKLSENDVQALVSIESVDSALDLVSHGFYAKFLSRRENIEETLVFFESAIENSIFSRLHKMQIVELFNVATPLGIMMRKEKEVEKLITISSGIEYGWKPENIASFTGRNLSWKP
jgi:V/A-type H+-transporting ATPase subunit C